MNARPDPYVEKTNFNAVQENILILPLCSMCLLNAVKCVLR